MKGIAAVLSAMSSFCWLTWSHWFVCTATMSACLAKVFDLVMHDTLRSCCCCCWFLLACWCVYLEKRQSISAAEEKGGDRNTKQSAAAG
jgi:hypothetical protein